ncbi:MAG: hypothetical protein COA66_15335 [Arcobacter sp.]|nr:MAG: hypothetical protein COA66_15335 [Arcobacter sp.]
MKFIIILILSVTFLFSASKSANLEKEKKEVIQLKKDLNQFYTKKENEYQDRKKELEVILSKIKKEKKTIQNIYDKNIATLKDIKGVVVGKTTKIYNGMKPKDAAKIFNKLIEDGEIDDVFDILLKLKEKKTTLILRFLSTEYSANITKMLQNYNITKGK